MVEHLQLKNNLNLLLIPKSSSNICLAGFIAPAGQVLEEGYFAKGINYLLERLFWSGTSKYPSNRQLNLYMEGLACQAHTYVGFENMQLFLEVPYYNQFKAVTLLADIIQHSQLETNDVDLQKRILKEKIFSNQKDEEIGTVGKSFVLKNLYLNQIEESSTYAPLENFMTLRKEDILDYYAHQFQPNKSYLVVAGNFEKEAIIDLAEQEWGLWAPKNKRFIDSMELKSQEAIQMPNISYRQKGSFFTEIHLGFVMDADPKSNFIDENGQWLDKSQMEFIRPEYFKQLGILSILNNILGQGLSSRLWSKAVEEEMTFSHISSEIINLKNCVYLQIFGVIENNQFTFGLESILKVLESFRKATVSINELSKAKENLKGRVFTGGENLLDSVTGTVNSYLNTRIIPDTDEMVGAISSIQTSEVRNLALDLFIPEKMSLFINGTAKETKLVDKLITKYLQ